MDVRTIVVVPVKDAIEHTHAFLEMLEGQEVERILVLDNGSRKPTRDLIAEHSRAERIDAAGLGIYDMWNRGFAEALVRHAPLVSVDGEIERGPLNVLMSNNDIVLPAGAVAELAAALRAGPDDLWAIYPDYNRAWDLRAKRPALAFTEGVLGDGGLFGACFMLAGERIPWTPLVDDTSYEWWYGDNHLARAIAEAGGRQARLAGLPVAHANEGTARGHPEVNEMKGRDRRRWMDSQRQRRGYRPPRRTVPGTKVWSPRGARLDGE